MRRLLLAACVGCALVGVAAKPKRAKASPPPSPPPAPSGPFELVSASFKTGGALPSDHRGDDDNVSPPLAWRNAPAGTQAFVLIADEAASSAAGKGQTNWLVYDIPSSVAELREELSGAGSSDVPRLGIKDDAGQEPIVVDPMEQVRCRDRAAQPWLRRRMSGVLPPPYPTTASARPASLTAPRPRPCPAPPRIRRSAGWAWAGTRTPRWRKCGS